MVSSTAPLRIAIVGAGPAGLTLASILHHKARQSAVHAPWTITLYEAEPCAAARRLGGSLDLGKKTGLAAIRAAGLLDRFNAFSRPEGQEMKAMTRFGEVVVHQKDPVKASSDLYSPEIDRADLNRVLCESLPDDAIHWGHKTIEVRTVGDHYELHFQNGTTAIADLVVGADGGWSRVRPLLTTERPVYSGVTFLDCTVRDFDRRFPELTDLVGDGSLYTFGAGNVLITQRNGYGVLRLYLGFKSPESWSEDSDVVRAASDEERAKMLVTTRYADWDARLQQLILAAGTPVDSDVEENIPAMVARTLYALPVGHQWDHRRGVALIGDAAHLMSPCAGEGVNTAMLDALQLAEAVTGAFNADSFHNAALDAVTQFEETMFKRMQVPMTKSAENLEIFVNESEVTAEVIVRLFEKKKIPTA